MSATENVPGPVPPVPNPAPDWGRVMEAAALEVLGEPPVRYEHEWRYGTHGSLVVNVSGPRAGQWRSWETDSGGGVLAFLQHHLNLDRQQARKWLRDRSLVDSRPTGRRSPPAPRPSSRTPSSERRAAKKQRREAGLRDFARRLWAASEQIPTLPEHPARRWMANRHLWRPEFPLPSSVRWLPATTPLFRGLHQGAGSIAVLMAPPSAWEAAWPKLPELASIHLVSIDADGMPALDRPEGHIDGAGHSRPGLGKRIIGKSTGAVAILGNPVIVESQAAVRVIEGLADGLALASRFGSTVIAGIGTPQRLARDADFVAWLVTTPHGVVIHSDADEPGQNAARALRRSLRDAGIQTRAVLPPEGRGKDSADVARHLPFPPLHESWTNRASTLATLHPTWPRWEVARQASIATEGDYDDQQS